MSWRCKCLLWKCTKAKPHPPFPAAEVTPCRSHLLPKPLRVQSPPWQGWGHCTHPCTYPGTSQRALGCRFPRQLNISFSCRSHRSSFLPGHPSCLGGSGQTSPIPVTFMPAEAPSHPSWAAKHLLHTFQGSRCLSVLLELSLKPREPTETRVLPQRECRTHSMRASHSMWNVNHKRSSSHSGFPTEFLDCFLL